MKNYLIIFCVAILASGCYNPERNCADFKNGKFQFDHLVNGEKQTTIFTRKDSIQIEQYQGKIDTAIVRWVNDCEFVLRKKHPKNMNEKKAISMKILTTSKNSYTFEFGLVGEDQKQQGTATILKP